MLKEKDEQDNHAAYESSVCNQNMAAHKEKIQALVDGSLGTEESLAYLRLLSAESANQLNQATFKLTVDILRATILPESALLFEQAGKLIDCCGTGGSGLSHYNTSTTVAFILAAAGLKVAKFGNRAASSQSGSFDLLDKLGIGATLPLPALPAILERTNLTFLFAPQFYPTLSALAPLRRALGKPTVFNYIGPLLNPADPVFRLIGVPNKQAQDLIAGHLHGEGQVEQALIVNAQSGLDELDVHSTNTIVKVSARQNQEGCRTAMVEIETLSEVTNSKLEGKREGPLSAEDNSKLFDALISGQLGTQNYYHALVCFNASAALSASGLVKNWEEGARVSAGLLRDGSVKAKFVQYQDQFR